MSSVVWEFLHARKTSIMVDWEPISEVALLARIRQGYRRMTPAQQRLWNAIKIVPEKWQQHPYGDPGGGLRLRSKDATDDADRAIKSRPQKTASDWGQSPRPPAAGLSRPALQCRNPVVPEGVPACRVLRPRVLTLDLREQRPRAVFAARATAVTFCKPSARD